MKLAEMIKKRMGLGKSSMNVAEINKEAYGKGNFLQKVQIEKTPFWIIGERDEGYYLVIGNNRLTDPLKSVQEVREYLEENKWMVMLQMIMVVMGDEQKIKEKKKL